MSRLTVLHVVLTMGETSAPYNEHCLAAAGRHDITLCTYFAPTVGPRAGVRLFAGDGSVSGFFRTLRAALEASRYDIVHAHAPHVGLGLLANAVLRRRRLKAATVFTAHNCYAAFKSRNRLMMMPVFVCFDQVVCCSQASFASFPRVFRGLAGQRITSIPNGVDLERVDRILAVPTRLSRHSAFTVAVVGRLIPVKNPLAVLEAFRAGADDSSRLVYVGEGPLRPEIERTSASLGLHGQVVSTGLVPRDTVYERVAAADLLVSASFIEGLPVAVLEAMACSRPVVLSDIAPHREIAGAADFIPLVRPDDVAGFAREIDRFKRMPVEERTAIGARCRRLVEERFSVRAMLQGYEAVYRRLAARATPA